MTVKAGQVVVGWPAASNTLHGFELVAGKRYRLSFRARSSGPLPLRVVAKVVHRYEPYTSAVQAPIPIGLAPRVYAVDQQAGPPLGGL